jgi:hypothetical protein
MHTGVKLCCLAHEEMYTRRDKKWTKYTSVRREFAVIKI